MNNDTTLKETKTSFSSILMSDISLLKSMTFASGEQPKIGMLGETNRPDFKTFTGLPVLLAFFHTLSKPLVHISCHVLQQLMKMAFEL